jgi:uncharacterized membrane protein
MSNPRNPMVDKDLLLINALSAILALAIFFIPDSPLRIVLGIPFIIFPSGYLVICTLFPKKKDLDAVERMAFSLGLSIVLVPLIGLVLNFTPFGIRLYPILISVSLFILLMSIITAYRRRALSIDERFVLPIPTNLPRWSELRKPNKLMSIGVIGLIVIAGGLTAYFISTPKVERFTEFYLLGSEGKTEGYPTQLILGENGTVVIGVVNHEYEETTYNIVIRLDNESIATITDIKLGSEEKWERNFTFTPQNTGDKMKLDFSLYRTGMDEPYQNVYLWIAVKLRK